MIRTLSVSNAAVARTLLTTEERRAAVGVTGSSYDTVLETLEARVAAAITAECNIAIGDGAPPTLVQEELTETFQMVSASVLLLSRRHEIEIASVTVDGTELAAEATLVDPESGFLYRVDGDDIISWCARKIVVVYDAGFSTIPPDLKMAAADFLRFAWAEKDRDPALKREVVDVPDVRRIEREYWVGSIPGQKGESAVPDVVAGQLQRFRNGPFL